MKAILMSIQPKWVAKILNGDKTIEVRKRFPKDYRGWVYIYCTKSQINQAREYFAFEQLHRLGKVVARFYCDNVEYYDDICYWSEENEKTTCLTPSDFFDYINHIKRFRACYFIHIAQLEIFNKPKELKEFYRTTTKIGMNMNGHSCVGYIGIPLTKAPQSWQFMEVEEND